MKSTRTNKFGAAVRPILFSTEMVQAILDGRKTQTRRLLEAQPKALFMYMGDDNNLYACFENGQAIPCPPGKPGDVLWVRETWAPLGDYPKCNYTFMYRADVEKPYSRWRPSIHMPFEACRIFLRIKSVRVERLQEISEEDAVAEGVEHDVFGQALVARKYDEKDAWFQVWTDALPNYVGYDKISSSSFRSLWKSIYGADSWEASPWVWVLEFERVSREEAGI